MKYWLTIFFIIFSPNNAFPFCFEEAGKFYNTDPTILEAIAITESNLKPSAVNINKNGSFDIGLMQINTRWLKKLNYSIEDLLDPCTNIKAGARILAYEIKQAGGNWLAIGHYHSKDKKRALIYMLKVYKQWLNLKKR